MNSDYTVQPPDFRFKEKGYIDWIKDYSSWFYQPNPERNNDGDVVFLRSTPLSQGNYQNEAMVMIGNESLEISKDQMVLVPIITATFIADEDQNPEWLFGMARGDISNGDNPPLNNQLKINGCPIDLDGLDNFAKFEFETPIYHVYIPDAPPGVSLKHQVEYPIEASGYFPAVTRGYFVLLQLHPDGPSEGKFYIHCEATGATTPRGPYNVSFFYHIIVRADPKRKGATPPPDRLSRNIAVDVLNKLNKGQITDTEFEVIKKCLGERKFVNSRVETLLNDLVKEAKTSREARPKSP